MREVTPAGELTRAPRRETLLLGRCRLVGRYRSEGGHGRYALKLRVRESGTRNGTELRVVGEGKMVSRWEEE